MAGDSATPSAAPGDLLGNEETELKRSITGRLLFFYVLGDVLGSGIYVLIGAVAGAVGGAFWLAFAVGITIAILTGLAYAELVTRYPRAAGAALYVNHAFGNRTLTFFTTICMLSMSMAAAASMAAGFSAYFAEVWSLPPGLLVAIGFIFVLALINFIGITESAWLNMVMTFVEVAGLLTILVIGAVYVSRGDANFSTLTEFDADGNPIFAIVAGCALAFFAMTGFENAANVAEETIDPAKNFPRALVGGMITAGVIYVLVSMTAALVVPVDTLAGSDAALLEVAKSGVLPIPVGVIGVIFAVIAMIAIANTSLVALVTESRILYGMAREDVVPGVFSRVHQARRSPWVALAFCVLVITTLLLVGGLLGRIGVPIDVVTRLATVTIVFTLFVYALVIVACLKLRRDPAGRGEGAGAVSTFRAPTALLYLGIVGNLILFVYVVVDDPTSLLWCAGLLAMGGVLFVIEKATGGRPRSEKAAS